MINKTRSIIIFNWRDPSDPLAGGAERVTLKHAQYWVAVGHQVTWVSGTFPGCKKEENKGKIRFIRLGSSRTLFLRAWWIFWIRLNGNFDVVIDEVHGLPMFSPLWSGDKKVITFIHEVAQEIWAEMFAVPISWLGQWFERWIFPRIYHSTLFWVDCQSTLLDLVKIGIPMKRISVIPCAIDPVPNIPKQSKEKDLTLIFVARLVKMKGIEFALQSFARILQDEPKAKLWVVGGGSTEYLKTLHVICKKLNIIKQVRFYGLVEEKQKFILLAKAHFLIHTSIREGFGLTVLEANSQRTPAAVFDVPALRDLVNDQNGIIVPFEDTDQLARQILLLFQNDKRYGRIQKTAYTFSQQFRWSTFTQQSEALVKV
ncbi:MAG: glycosyltransferase family 4 protein [Patescibacteria group bacterium]